MSLTAKRTIRMFTGVKRESQLEILLGLKFKDVQFGLNGVFIAWWDVVEELDSSVQYDQIKVCMRLF